MELAKSQNITVSWQRSASEALWAPQPALPPEAVRHLRDRRRVRRGFRAAARRWRGRFHEADFVRHQAVEGINQNVYLVLI